MYTLFGYGQLHIEGTFFIGENAEVHVWNNLEITTASGELSNEGILEVEGDFQRTGDAAFVGNPNDMGARTVVFRNDNFNTNNNQRISGEMTGDNAFYKVVIDNLGDGTVDMDANIEITNNLQFVDGRLRTDVTSHLDGDNYQNEVFVSSPEAAAITGYTLTGAADRFVEGKLRRAAEGMGDLLDFPVGLGQGSEPFRINFFEPTSLTSILGTHQMNSTTPLGLTQQCDVGTEGDPFTPDGILDNLTIDCVLGQWLITSDDNITSEYGITFYPSDELMEQCSDGLYFFVGKDGQLDDCPDVTFRNGIFRSGLVGFSNFDIATASSSSSTFTAVEVIPSTDKRVTLFPNPVNSGLLNVKLEGNVFRAGESLIEVYNSIGQMIYNQEIDLFGNTQTIQIPLSSRNTGLHHIVIRNEIQMTSRTFIVVE